MKLKFISNITLGALSLAILTGCAGNMINVDSDTDFEIENEKFTNTYPYHIQDIVIGRNTLRQGYNIISYLPYNSTNLATFEKILIELNQKSKTINNMQCSKRKKTYVKCKNKFAAKPTQGLFYFLKSDLKNIYLVEEVFYLRIGVPIDNTFYQMHNILVDILNKNHIAIESENIKVDEDMLVGHNKTKLINK